MSSFRASLPAKYLGRSILLAIGIPLLAPATAPAQAPEGVIRYLARELPGFVGPGSASDVDTDPATGDWYVAGSSTPADAVESRAVLWRNGVMTDLGTLGIGTQARAVKVIDGLPTVVGHGHLGAPTFETRGFVWRDGQMALLPNLGRGSCEIADLDLDGTIVGTTQPEIGQNAATLWKDGGLFDLEVEAQYMNSASAIDGTAVAGYRKRRYFGPHIGALWQGAQRTDLGTLGGTESFAHDVAVVDGSPWVVGESDLPLTTRDHPFLWRNGVLTDLGTLGGAPGEGAGVARAINHQGQVVGSASLPDLRPRAFLWQAGTMVNLNDLVLNLPEGLLLDATAIDDHGRVLVRGRPSLDAADRSYLLDPVTVTDPAPAITGVSPAQAKQGDTVDVAIAGTGFTPATTVSFGTGIAVNQVSYTPGAPGAGTLNARIQIAGDAELGLRTVRVANADLQWDAVEQGFTVLEGPPALRSFGFHFNPKVQGGRRLTGFVVLSRPAPSPRGALVTFTSSNRAFRPPAKVKIPRGHTTLRRSFVYRTRRVRSPTTYTVTATYGGVSRSQAITLLPR